MLFVALELIFLLRKQFNKDIILATKQFKPFPIFKILQNIVNLPVSVSNNKPFLYSKVTSRLAGQFEMTNLVFAGLLPALLFITFHPYIIVGIIHEESKLLTLDEEGKM